MREVEVEVGCFGYFSGQVRCRVDHIEQLTVTQIPRHQKCLVLPGFPCLFYDSKARLTGVLVVTDETGFKKVDVFSQVMNFWDPELEDVF